MLIMQFPNGMWRPVAFKYSIYVWAIHLQDILQVRWVELLLFGTDNESWCQALKQNY